MRVGWGGVGWGDDGEELSLRDVEKPENISMTLMVWFILAIVSWSKAAFF